MTMTTTFVGQDSAGFNDAGKRIERFWFAVGAEDGTEFAITSDGQIIDADGVPCHEGDTMSQGIRRNIHDVLNGGDPAVEGIRAAALAALDLH